MLLTKVPCEFGFLGNIHVLRNQDFGFSDLLPFVITFSTERNQKSPFSAVKGGFFKSQMCTTVKFQLFN